MTAATKMWCLGLFLPLVIGEFVPEGQLQYRTFLILRSIMDITMAPVACLDKAMYLSDVTDDRRQLHGQRVLPRVLNHSDVIYLRIRL